MPLYPDEVDAWRSADLRKFALSRPHAPTVVVWNGDHVSREATKLSIGAVADVVVALNIALDIMTVNTTNPDGGWEHSLLH